MSAITDLYIFRTLTNLHAGQGDTTYGIADKEVQKDPLDQLPVVHSSGIKGAFRELMAHIKKQDGNYKGNGDGHDHEVVEKIFGADTSSRNPKATSFRSGDHLFFDARLLSIPVRSNVIPFFRATSIHLLQEFVDYCKSVNYEGAAAVETALKPLWESVKAGDRLVQPSLGEPLVLNQTFNGTIVLESWKATKGQLEAPLYMNASAWLGENIALLDHGDLKKICTKLPVIARNQLENGLSQNLWYEEVVPRETRFYTYLLRPGNDDSFYEEISGQVNGRVQIGGNATIGYGQCLFERKPFAV